MFDVVVEMSYGYLEVFWRYILKWLGKIDGWF